LRPSLPAHMYAVLEGEHEVRPYTSVWADSSISGFVGIPMAETILPGATIGILGGGQLARMLALAARPMGYRVAVLDPDADCPAAGVSDVVIATPYDDPDGLDRLANISDVITLEFENVPGDALTQLEARVPVHPGRSVLEIARDRIKEKQFLNGAGAQTAPWESIVQAGDLERAAASVGFPAILKTATLGYDGKGQTRVNSLEEAQAAWASMRRAPCVLEGIVKFDLEISVIVARSSTGEEHAFAPFENQHKNGILDLTIWPARVPDGVSRRATDLALRIAKKIGVIGLLTIEMFVTPDGRVLVNELAPRPHNSGHLTIEASQTSQFAQAIRAVCGLPLGDTTPRSAAMANLLGDAWQSGEPNWNAALGAGANLHLYGKREARPGRKMGHLTALGSNPTRALERVQAARSALESRSALETEHFNTASTRESSMRPTK
jgi:5-(carboxyamino)imidazole ribonucleotide synthase